MEKDVRRTDRNVPFFAGSRNPSVAMLRRILLTYSVYNFDLSYCQVNIILHSHDEYTCVIYIIWYCSFSLLYYISLRAMAIPIWMLPGGTLRHSVLSGGQKGHSGNMLPCFDDVLPEAVDAEPACDPARCEWRDVSASAQTGHGRILWLAERAQDAIQGMLQGTRDMAKRMTWLRCCCM